jgi:hypothetical protein
MILCGYFACTLQLLCRYVLYTNYFSTLTTLATTAMIMTTATATATPKTPHYTNPSPSYLSNKPTCQTWNFLALGGKRAPLCVRAFSSSAIAAAGRRSSSMVVVVAVVVVVDVEVREGRDWKNIFMAGVPLLLPLLGLVRAGEREEEEEEDVRDEEKRRYGANTHRLSAFPCRGCGRRRMRDVHWDCMMERSCAEMI